ncbi:hypothetical protein IVB15_06650 [Bradyrhizobium sp. 182]|uniref:hypothetical protein n=1 Tax=unclassified Bradyrhizobium TaxID=2631580 RepID=UPI001FFA9CBE|nr:MULTISPECIES: hypothetical protein [unclassified Bradyrhizobium]MCK1419364.1 hypothetical protein [Bradyrhizobium sp. CW12]MCK1527430.1 hypothetical protein [Bradyrhizobium sp. 182]MCK1544799.1 hypothetical protein [Bradyrhizobium sp. 179]MCK1618597.1 hypothetical protein [Bradyrhizobium sp. 159]MCK1643467.1 hypothetical protein [Bradyrhizobium sp. 154]
MPFHGLDLNLLITIDAPDGERSRTAAGLMGSSDDRQFASRPSICKASHARRRSVLEQRTSSFGLEGESPSCSDHWSDSDGQARLRSAGERHNEAVLPRLPFSNFYKITETLWNELLNGRTIQRRGVT